MKLDAELIYEAALDDDLFAQMPAIIARSMDARSCVLHWRDQSNAAEIFTHSGYFSDGQMADYASNFAGHDLWTDAGMRQGFVNAAWRTTDIVPTADYERSVFYNEWIRGMGDDTLYCCGSVMRTVHGDGIIGLHRGRTQGDFSIRSLRQLNAQVEHLRRMFAVRARISALTDRRDLLGEIFESGQHVALTLSSDGGLALANARGDALLRSGRVLQIRNGKVQPALDDGGCFAAAIAAALAQRERRASDVWLRSITGDSIFVEVMPLSSSRRCVLVTIHAPRKPAPREIVAQRLQGQYRLTASEADIALRLADGLSLRDISDRRCSAIATVRTQVKQILSKLHVRRQADVVRTVASLSG